MKLPGPDAGWLQPLKKMKPGPTGLSSGTGTLLLRPRWKLRSQHRSSTSGWVWR